MTNDQSGSETKTSAQFFNNWVSLTGGIVAIGSLFAFAFLVAMNSMSKDGNPYLGILTYLIAPGFLIMGLATIFIGWWIQRRQARNLTADSAPPALSIDLSRPRDRRYLVIFGSGTIVFLLLTAFGSYQTYHFTESVEFCGKTCHVVMKPEFVTYHRSAHARVSCAECHIGSGASFYVKSKISGAYQVYATLFSKYEHPIPTPVENLRPAQDTCERCHWPEKFTGNLDRTYDHFLSDKKNTPYSVRMLLRVGGGQPGQGPFGGIHWHMNVVNKVEYYATDRQRQTIPWVRMTSKEGAVTVYRDPEYKGEPPADAIRRMDCIDCHNHPAHVMLPANEAIELAMATGKVSTKLPNLKRIAVQAMTQPYATEAAGVKGVGDFLRAKYADAKDLDPTVAGVQEAFKANFFPEMKADWRGYPNNIGHKDWPGCFRCHDEKHVSADGKKKITSSDCTACHIILQQSKDGEATQLAPKGLEFKHPGGELDGSLLCSDCHNGGIQK
jgi:nitrate/TMAO reductase-like tetraheme cytochrome c subunit